MEFTRRSAVLWLLRAVFQFGTIRATRSLESLLQDRFHRPGFARQFSKSEKYRLGQNSRQHGKHDDRFVFRSSLQDHGIKLIDSSRDFRKPAQSRRGLFEPLMHCSSTLKIECFARGFAIALKLMGKSLAGSRKRRKDAPCLHIVFFLRATRETRCQTHLHLRINTPWKFRVAPNLDLAAPYFEEIEKSLCKRLRAFPRSERTKIESAIPGNPPRHITARILITQIYLQHRRWPQTHQVPITLRKSTASTPVQGQCLFEFRTGYAVAHTRRDTPQIQPFRSRFGFTKQPLSGTTDISGAREVGLRASLAHFNQQNARTRGKRCEKYLVVTWLKFQAAIKFKHREKNTLPGGSAGKLQPSVRFQNPCGNHEPLNLAGPLVNLSDARIAIRTLHGILAAVPVASVNLDRFMRHARGHFARE